MGYMQHHAILVTTYRQSLAEMARAKAQEIFGEEFSTLVSEPVTNGYHSFAIFPDGSKEGWQDSDQGERYRADFISWLKAHDEYGWVLVQYGDDALETCILDDSDADNRNGVLPTEVEGSVTHVADTPLLATREDSRH